MRRPWVQLLVLVLLLATAVYLGWRGVKKVRQSSSETALCEAVMEGDLERALELGDQLAASGLYDPVAAECHCAALVETGRAEQCVQMIEDLLARPDAGDWLPGPSMAPVIVERRSARGELPGAADLAHRAALRYPDVFLLLYLELKLRSQLEDEEIVLREMLQRVPSAGAAAPELLLEIVRRYLARNDWEQALVLLGNRPPPDPEVQRSWFELQMHALAGLGDFESLLAANKLWKQVGGNPAEADAQYAVALSFFGLAEDVRGIGILELLTSAMESKDLIENEDLRKSLVYRYIGSLVLKDQHDKALEQFDLALAEYEDLFGLTREDIVLSRTQDLLQAGDLVASKATLVFDVTDLQPGDRLLLSPPPSAPVDADYKEAEVEGVGRVEVTRGVGVDPQRWVLKDAADNTLGSGAVWPVPGSPVSVEIARRSPSPGPPVYRSESHPADGRRRVFVAILDCADWRLIQYLRHRGELPALDYLLRLGQRSVLISDPPFTAAAMRSIASPAVQGVSSFMSLLYQLGTEIEGLNFIGTNPFEPLRWVTPAGGDLFTVLGGTQVAVVNMLHSYGPIQAGRNAQMIGPFGQVREISGLRGSRLLSPDERQRYPGLLDVDDASRGLIEEMVADFDALDSLVARGDADLVMLRVASLDVFTHAHFAQVVTSGQDDGDRPLFWFYRAVRWARRGRHPDRDVRPRDPHGAGARHPLFLRRRGWRRVERAHPRQSGSEGDRPHAGGAVWGGDRVAGHRHGDLGAGNQDRRLTKRLATVPAGVGG
jgi:tetratricopeptide (TPR) repeat protein